MKVWGAFNSLFDIAHEKFGHQGFAFIVGVVFNVIRNIGCLLNMINVEVLVNLAATSLISGSIYAAISFVKDVINHYFFKNRK